MQCQKKQFSVWITLTCGQAARKIIAASRESDERGKKRVFLFRVISSSREFGRRKRGNFDFASFWLIIFVRVVKNIFREIAEKFQEVQEKD